VGLDCHYTADRRRLAESRSRRQRGAAEEAWCSRRGLWHSAVRLVLAPVGGLGTVGVGTASCVGGTRRWVVRERNGGFRADDLPAVGGRGGPMAAVRQASQNERW
jgi:hypothetical protein